MRARHRIQHLGLAGLLESLERLSAHRGIDRLIRHADRGGELFENEEDYAVADQRAPVELAQHLLLFFREAAALVRPLTIVEEPAAELRLDDAVQIFVEAVRSAAQIEVERIG